MTVPLDRLYHYIESIAKDICSDDVIIYRFYPHGSKKLEDLSTIQPYSPVEQATLPQIYCYDQEPLNYDMYANFNHQNPNIEQLMIKHNITIPDYNLCVNRFHIYDSHIIIHSEQRSRNLDKYRNSNYFIPVYYWSHAIIARDWFRYAEHDKFVKNIKKTFLIYNRAWSGTREYRLKFMDLLIDYNLVDSCRTTVNPIEPELNIHYSNYEFANPVLQPTHHLEEFISNISTATSAASADYSSDDYCSTEFEVVLETLFDDDRLHLTEKTLRPIATGQPFLLVATHGSLEYLRSYGFKTFASVIDESYDTIEDPLLRLEAIVKSMEKIANWTEAERAEKLMLANQIASYNRERFFSSDFSNQVAEELQLNLSTALNLVETTNTSKRFINRRKELMKYDGIKSDILSVSSADLIKILQCARKYYNKH